MKLTIRHFMPGRVRLHIPLLYHESHLVDCAVEWLEKQAGIESVRVNSACASLVIEYNRRQPELWAQISFFLQNATIEQLRMLAGHTAVKPKTGAKLSPAELAKTAAQSGGRR